MNIEIYQKLNHLIDFTQFKENNSQGNIKSTTSFTGGYIGFYQL